jgi:hypothetical protein
MDAIASNTPSQGLSMFAAMIGSPMHTVAAINAIINPRSEITSVSPGRV